MVRYYGYRIQLIVVLNLFLSYYYKSIETINVQKQRFSLRNPGRIILIKLGNIYMFFNIKLVLYLMVIGSMLCVTSVAVWRCVIACP